MALLAYWRALCFLNGPVKVCLLSICNFNTGYMDQLINKVLALLDPSLLAFTFESRGTSSAPAIRSSQTLHNGMLVKHLHLFLGESTGVGIKGLCSSQLWVVLH